MSSTTLNGAATAPATRSTSRHSRRSYGDHRRTSFHSEKHDDLEERQRLSREVSRQSTKRQPRWWKIRLFKGMIDDVKRRAPYYWTDWRDAWDYRVVPATVYMYFAKYVKAIHHIDIPAPSHSMLHSPSSSRETTPGTLVKLVLERGCSQFPICYHSIHRYTNL